MYFLMPKLVVLHLLVILLVTPIRQEFLYEYIKEQIQKEFLIRCGKIL